MALWLRDSPLKTFYGLGMDYAWGRNSMDVFETEAKRAGKTFLGAVFSPTSVAANAPAMLVVTLSNTNPFALTQSAITVPVPPGLTLGSQAPTSTCSGAALSLKVTEETACFSLATRCM